MIRTDYPDDRVTPTVPGGRTTVAFAATAIETDDAFEEEEEESGSPETALGYGSLLSLGSSMRKKKPLIVIDPVEAENEARRVQFIAAQQLVDPDEADGIAFREAPVLFVEPEEAEPSPDEIGDSEDRGPEAETAEEQTLSEWTDGEVLEMEPAVEAEEDVAEVDDDDELSIAVEGLARIYEEHGLEPLSAGEPEVLQDEAPHSEPALAPHGHSLRARMPTQAPRRTFGDHALAFLAWLRDWLTRPR
ncbi:hypothetical protein KRR38_27085 [Novosphingobium sp. G106]|uniref:hypothetical protein n=1 Tax=Novosphingobium sp. G106 TaxID=2849500 RepID=UPI001C2CD294|nr:hypothetical protein [Novosphingobium sp. G106]MBV1691249.1 hypothetical protein [Novosphingobium sp. G106]